MDAQRDPAVICLADGSRAARNAMLAAECVAARLDRRVVALHSDSAEDLRRTAIDEPGELVVVGGNGRGGLMGALRPGVQDDLAADCPCPVLVVPERLDDSGLLAPACWTRAVVCGIDSTGECVVAAHVAAALARAFETRLVLAHVCRVATSTVGAMPVAAAPTLTDVRALMEGEREREIARLEQVRSALPGDLDVELATTRGQPATGLEQIARNEGSSLLALGSRGHNALLRAVLGSVAGSLIAHARRPVVVVTPAAGAGTLARSAAAVGVGR